MSKKNKRASRKQIKETLNLVRDHLFDIIDHPEKLNKIPDQATLVLFPVPTKSKKAA